MGLQSLGHAAATFQEAPRIIELALGLVGAEPAMRLNGVAYYHVDDIVRAMKYLSARDAQRALEVANKAASEGDR